MRLIRFRAKRVDNGQWIHGTSLISFAPGDGEAQYFIPYSGKSCDAYADASGIIDRFDGMKVYQVQPLTICQYTCQDDALHSRIYEGDIVEHAGKRYVIRYIPRHARFAGKNKNVVFAVFAFRNCKIIGNIFDNPELMEDDKCL